MKDIASMFSQLKKILTTIEEETFKVGVRTKIFAIENKQVLDKINSYASSMKNLNILKDESNLKAFSLSPIKKGLVRKSDSLVPFEINNSFFSKIRENHKISPIKSKKSLNCNTPLNRKSNSMNKSFSKPSLELNPLHFLSGLDASNSRNTISEIEKRSDFLEFVKEITKI